MKSSVRTGLAAAMAMTIAGWSAPAAAEDMLVGVDGGVLLPLGDWSEVTGLGFGALGRFEYAMDTQMSATGRFGYIVHLEKDDKYRTTEMPIFAGLRYALGEGPDGMFLAGEAGLVNFTFRRPVASGVFGTQADGGEKASDSELKFGGAAGVGYRSGKIEGRAGAFIASFGDLGETFGVLVTVGYNFASF